jgi:hypothetical protein
LEVLTANASARRVWEQLGFEPYALSMAAPLEQLDRRLNETPGGEWRASMHVQTDDELSVERAVGQFLPRLEQPDVRTGDSWIRVADPVLDRDRDAQGRLARELSERLGAVTVALAQEGPVVRFRLYESGRMVDEYLSVPTFYGELSLGDELALAANPTLVARLTGADKEAVRRVARTASAPSELPPAAELYDQISELMGLEPCARSRSRSWRSGSARWRSSTCGRRQSTTAAAASPATRARAMSRVRATSTSTG